MEYMSKSGNHKQNSFWNIIQKSSFAVFFGCASYLLVSTYLFSWTTPINDYERGVPRLLSYSEIVLVVAVVSLIFVFISTKLKNKN